MKKEYIDTDVYTESKKRIRHIIESFDSILVCFSGGKDSLAVLHLVEEVYQEMGIKKKIKVVFRDEEVIPDDVVRFVQKKAESGKYDFRYYAIPLKSNKFILGKTYEYVQWDRNRRWLRQPPSYAITLPEGQYHEFSQYDADSFICKDEKGKVALINGIRAEESLLRLNACCIKKNENYINATKDDRIKMCKPIFDWTENDIFVYFFKQKIEYCAIYDAQTLNGDKLRVSTPLHAESAKCFAKIKTLYPQFYQQLIDLFPEMIVQSMYYSSLAKGDTTFMNYEHSFTGVRNYIKDTIEDVHMRALALRAVNLAENTKKNKYKQGITKNCGGFPVLYVYKAIQRGSYKRGCIMPNCAPTKDELEYEKQLVE